MNKKWIKQLKCEHSDGSGGISSSSGEIEAFIETLLKAEHFRGFVEGSDITGSIGVEICACKLHDQRKKYRAKIKTLKDANSEDNMISLEARLQKNDAYNECIKIIK